MRWEGTDNFGNLMVAESSSTSVADVYADLRSLCVEVFGRHGGPVTFAIDLEYQEIAAPDGNNVTHVMRVPWFVAGDESSFDAIRDQLSEIVLEMGREATITGPWP